MDIHLTRGTEHNGPYPLKSVGELLQAGELEGSVWAWHEGLDEWMALEELKAFACSNTGCLLHGQSITTADARSLSFECVLCKSVLGEPVSALSPLEEKIMTGYPNLIAVPFARLHEKREVESRQRLLMETTTNLFKYLALVVETEYLTGDHVLPELTAVIEDKLSANIPLSAWPMFTASAILALEKEGHEFFAAELPGYFRRMDEFTGNRPPSGDRVEIYGQGYWNEDGDFIEQKEKTGRFNALISYRNKWAHKPNLPEAQAQAEFEYYYQVLLDSLEAMEWCASYPLYRHEDEQAYRLMGTCPITEESLPGVKGKEGNLHLGHPEGKPPLELVPLFIVPGDYLPEPGSDLFFYDAYTGKRIVYVSPEGHAEDIQATVGRWRKLIQGKRVLWPLLGKSGLDPAELTRRNSEATGHTRDDLRQIGKVIKGLYYSRKEIEANLTGWPGSMPPLLALRSAAGGGKTCMMDHLAGQWQKEELPVLFIRAQGLEQADLLKLVQDRLRLEEEVTFADLAGALEQPLLILIDGLNEHASPRDFLASILEQAGEAKERAFKCFFTVRSENLDWVELNEGEKQLFQAEASTENVPTKEEDVKLPGPLLTPLDRLEVEAMWKDYATNDPKRFRPRFSFEEAQRAKGAQVDAMEWMSRPLLLRLLLEVYHGRICPSVIGRYPLFTDYLKQLGQKTRDNNAFLLNVARVCLEADTIVLDLDALYTDYRTREVMNDSYHFSPYRRLIREGVLVELREGETRRIGFGMEALAEHVLGEVLLVDGVADTPHGLATAGADKNKDFPQVKRAVQVALQARVEEQGRTYLFEFIDAPVEGVGWLAGGVLGQLILESGEAVLIANELMANPTLEDLGAAEFAATYLDKEMAYQPTVDFLSRVVELAEKPFADTEELVGCTSWLAGAFQTTGQYDQALEYYQKTLTNVLNRLGSDHPHAAQCYNYIGTVYHGGKSEYERALENYTKALDINLNHLDSDHIDLAPNYSNIGAVHDMMGNHDEALKYMERSAAITIKHLGPAHPDLVPIYSNIGLANTNLDDYSRALEYLHKALDIQVKDKGPEHLELAQIYKNLGGTHHDKDEHDKALKYYQKALVIQVKRLGPEHPEVGKTYNNFATTHIGKGDFDQALEYNQKALAIKIKQLGPDHPSVAISYVNIGPLLYRHKNEYDQALEYLRKALAIKLKQQGVDPLSTAECYGHIALIHQEEGEYDQALEHHQKALAIRLKKLGPDHLDVATSYNKIGSVYYQEANYDRALEYYQKALAIDIEQLDPDHSEMALIYNNIGGTLSCKGEYDHALENLQKALAVITLKQSRPNDSAIAEVYHNIGYAHEGKGELDQALEYYQKSLSIRHEVLGPDHPSVAYLYNSIGGIHSAKDEYEQAIDYYEKELAIQIKQLGEEHSIVVAIYENLGWVYQDKGEYDQALEYFQKALDIQLKKLGPDHSDVAMSYNFMGVVHFSKGECDQALEYFQKALAIRLKKLGPDHPDVASTLHNLATLYL